MIDYNLVRKYASDTYRYARNNDDRVVNSLINYYDEGKKSPTVAQIIFRDEVLKSNARYSEQIGEEMQSGVLSAIKDSLKKVLYAKYNIQEADNHPDVKPHLSEYAKSYSKLYPRSIRLRDHLVKSGKVEFDRVTPKCNWFQKIQLAKYAKSLKKH